jgi:uncharacterized protein with gpF-like domain
MSEGLRLPSLGDLDKLLPIGKDDKQLAEIGLRNVSAAYARGARIALEEVEARKQAFQLSDEMLESITDTVNDVFDYDYWLNNVGNHTRRLLKERIIESIRAGSSPQELIEQLIEDRPGLFSEERATRIARTETTAALNGGQFLARQEMLSEGVIEGQEWVATLDEVTRPTHIAADGQRRFGTTPFLIGGYPARYPGDPNLPARERVNCRCTTVSIIPGEG